MPTATTSRLSLLWRAVRRTLHVALVALLAFGGAVLIGLVPVNRGFKSPAEGIDIIVYIDPAHSEIILPIVTDVHDWGPWFSASDFPDQTGFETHVALGWGDREFFLHTPTWDDLRADLTARSMLLPTDTVMHVELMHLPPENEYYRHVTIDRAGYQRMVEFIQSSFVLDGSPQSGGVEPRPLVGWHYDGRCDAFYEAQGTYSMLYTCNAWTGDCLEVAGVRTGCWTPFPMGILQTDD
ncbi:TIGR02117 family protein [Aeoliella sp.]|uniref:TIGR02117 family protein n=1 Tax=Aeoliella sp. TaxID=2795800 RepID=UPI003CCC07FE